MKRLYFFVKNKILLLASRKGSIQALYIITKAVSACRREILRKVTVKSLLHPPSAAWREGANLQPSLLRPLGAGAAGLPRAHWHCLPLAQANARAHLTRV